MVQVDKEKLGKYLQVSASKLASKGVASVQSRVVNLTELQPDLTTLQLQQGLIVALKAYMALLPGHIRRNGWMWSRLEPMRPSLDPMTGGLVRGFLLPGNWSIDLLGAVCSCNVMLPMEKLRRLSSIRMPWMGR